MGFVTDRELDERIKKALKEVGSIDVKSVEREYDKINEHLTHFWERVKEDVQTEDFSELKRNVNMLKYLYEKKTVYANLLDVL